MTKKPSKKPERGGPLADAAPIGDPERQLREQLETWQRRLEENPELASRSWLELYSDDPVEMFREFERELRRHAGKVGGGTRRKPVEQWQLAIKDEVARLIVTAPKLSNRDVAKKVSGKADRDVETVRKYVATVRRDLKKIKLGG